METNQPWDQLAEVDRLRMATKREAAKTPRAALVVLAVGTFAFFSSYAIDSAWIDVLAPIAWLAFIVAWVRWLRGAGRARPGRPPLSRAQWKQEITLWLVLFLVANLITALGAQVSWVLAGVLMGVLGAAVGVGSGWFAERR